MEVLEIQNSSAIAKVSFDSAESLVGVAFTSNPEKFYEFSCDDVNLIRQQIETVESVGKFISLLKKEGTLKAI